MSRLFIALMLLCFASSAAAQQNIRGQALSSAARTAAQVNSADLTNAAQRGVQVVVNVSAFTSGTYTPKIQGKDAVSGAYYDLLVGTAMSGTGTQVLSVYPGIAVTANVSASTVLPATWRVQVNGASTPSMTFSVGYSLGL